MDTFLNAYNEVVNEEGQPVDERCVPLHVNDEVRLVGFPKSAGIVMGILPSGRVSVKWLTTAFGDTLLHFIQQSERGTHLVHANQETDQ